MRFLVVIGLCSLTAALFADTPSIDGTY